MPKLGRQRWAAMDPAGRSARTSLLRQLSPRGIMLGCRCRHVRRAVLFLLLAAGVSGLLIFRSFSSRGVPRAGNENDPAGSSYPWLGGSQRAALPQRSMYTEERDDVRGVGIPRLWSSSGQDGQKPSLRRADNGSFPSSLSSSPKEANSDERKKKIEDEERQATDETRDVSKNNGEKTTVVTSSSPGKIDVVMGGKGDVSVDVGVNVGDHHHHQQQQQQQQHPLSSPSASHQPSQTSSQAVGVAGVGGGGGGVGGGGSGDAYVKAANINTTTTNNTNNKNIIITNNINNKNITTTANNINHDPSNTHTDAEQPQPEPDCRDVEFPVERAAAVALAAAAAVGPATATPLQQLRLFRPALTGSQRCMLVREVVALCAALRQAGIPHFLFGGTLIGSWRHHAVVPWDDDVDIAVEYSRRHDLRQALTAAMEGTEFHFAERGSVSWKFYSDNGSIIPRWPWRWPFIDICFFDANETHVWEHERAMFPEYVFPREWVFPVVIRPFHGLMLPAPRDTEKVLDWTYNLTLCAIGAHSHQREKPRPAAEVTSLPCDALRPIFPFVRRVTSEGAGCNETLVRNGTVIGWTLLGGAPCPGSSDEV